MQLPNIQYSSELFQETIGNHADFIYNYIMLITMTLSHIYIVEHNQIKLHSHVTISITVYS